jgi:CBS domain containing-hemolysin-like protein
MVRIFGPFSSILVNWSTRMESRFIYQRSGIDDTSKEDLDKAIELTVSSETESSEEADILRGIIKFGNVAAKQIMRSRVDVVAVEQGSGFSELMGVIKESGFSRIPVYQEDFDNIVGILYVKDLLGFAQEEDGFNWQQFIRDDVLYVPESKKIDDLLKEFQLRRLHMGIVVDEFGGSSGIVTLEDIMEEVIGEIKDEFDEDEEVDFIKINDYNFIFDGKTMLHDVARIINVDKAEFDQLRGDADSLAGLLLHHFGMIPRKDRTLVLSPFRFKIVSVSKRRIEKIHLTIL